MTCQMPFQIMWSKMAYVYGHLAVTYSEIFFIFYQQSPLKLSIIKMQLKERRKVINNLKLNVI